MSKYWLESPGSLHKTPANSNASKAPGSLSDNTGISNASKAPGSLDYRKTFLLVTSFLRGLRLPSSPSLRSRDRPRLAVAQDRRSCWISQDRRSCGLAEVACHLGMPKTGHGRPVFEHAPPRSLRSLVRCLRRRGRIERPAPFIPTPAVGRISAPLAVGRISAPLAVGRISAPLAAVQGSAPLAAGRVGRSRELVGSAISGGWTGL